jgi:DNA-binding NarL/FixJ family response regulator
MNKLSPKPTDGAIGVFVIANYELVQQALKVLIAANKDVSVTGTCSFEKDILHPNEIANSDVAVLYCLTGDRMEIISDLLNLAPELRVVAVIERDDLDSQAKAIKLGAVGIVHKEQSAKMLVEAIRQTYQGETWLNQVILNKILVNERSGKGKSMNFAGGKKPDSLTPRELEVIRMIGVGLKNKEIAKKLSITEATVRHHLSSIYGKLGVKDRLNLVIFAHGSGLIQLSPNDKEPPSAAY